MVRTILLLIASVVGLAILRNLLRGVGSLLQGAMGGAAKNKKASASSPSKQNVQGGRLVQDPNTGTYIDPAHAVKAKVGGSVHYFESEESRQAYVRAHS